MRQHEQALLLLKKAEEDIALLAEVLVSERIAEKNLGIRRNTWNFQGDLDR